LVMMTCIYGTNIISKFHSQIYSLVLIMMRGRRSPNPKRRKETTYSIFGYSLSIRYAAILRGDLDELVEADLSPIKFLPITLSPNDQNPSCSVILAAGRSRGRSSSELYSGQSSEADRLPTLPRSITQSCSGPGRRSDRSSSGPYSRRSSEADRLLAYHRVSPRAAPGQARATGGASLDRTPGRAVKLVGFRSDSGALSRATPGQAGAVARATPGNSGPLRDDILSL
jgi:hypothetical protein